MAQIKVLEGKLVASDEQFQKVQQSLASIQANARNSKDQGPINPQLRKSVYQGPINRQLRKSDVEDSEKYFGASKTLRTAAHRKMVMQFVRDQYPQARFERIYDASTHGWNQENFISCCVKKGWTLSII